MLPRFSPFDTAASAMLDAPQSIRGSHKKKETKVRVAGGGIVPRRGVAHLSSLLLQARPESIKVQHRCVQTEYFSARQILLAMERILSGFERLFVGKDVRIFWPY